MKLTATCLILSLSLLTACGGPPKEDAPRKGIVYGIVADAQTGDQVIGVSVKLLGTTLSARTNVDGYFQIVGVPVGEYRLRVTSVDYLDREVDCHLTKSHDSRPLLIELDRNPNIDDSKRLTTPTGPSNSDD